MNAWQAARQLAHLLEAATWPDAPSEVVFASVHVTAGVLEEALAELKVPFALVRPRDAEADPDEPRLLTHRFEVDVVTAVAGDAIGERVLIGSNRTGGQGSSRGRGVLELEEEALAAIQQLGQQDGVRVQARTRSEVEVAPLEAIGYIAARSLGIEALLTQARHYAPPSALDAAQGAPGDADLTWTLPPDRFDRRRVRLRRAAGAVPPATIGAGAEVALPADLPVAFTDSPGAGQFSWSLFAAYDETGAGADERFSGPDSVTFTVV